jgi:hypothetical protein
LATNLQLCRRVANWSLKATHLTCSILVEEKRDESLARLLLTVWVDSHEPKKFGSVIPGIGTEMVKINRNVS